MDRYPLLYIFILFYKYHGRVPRLIRPKLFNDKIVWRLFFDRSDFVVWACDKLRMKEEAQRRCPEVLIPETLATFPDISQIKNFQLTGDWVLKEISASGQVYFGSGNPDEQEYDEIVHLVAAWEKATAIRRKREWGYSKGQRGYLIERRISTEELADYKFHTFNGEVKFMSFHNGRKDGLRHAIYSAEGELLPVRWGPSLPEELPPLPDTFRAMRTYAEKLGQGIDYVRVDFYSNEGVIYFGEFTPYVGEGLEKIEPREIELQFGDYWTLPRYQDVRRKSR
jgi:hypothetical protein